ncbi:MAG: Transcription factor Pcc1 domain-containing protein [Cenarchaeum symbiont of Oopsacas minuta]|nr:Transcription factor Pcc1 domain-containing protein [Cenarchaeum symbiont of Oopsacas minuta]
MSKFNIEIKADAGNHTKAIYESIKTDNKFYPENPTDADISYDDGSLCINVHSESLPHLRASVNSLLGLIRVCEKSLDI